MMGNSNPQPELFYKISLEQFVPEDHPLRAIRPFINVKRLRRICKPFYSHTGRPSIAPERLFLALIGGYLLSIPSERKLMMELECNLALRWFVGLDLSEHAWDASAFSQNRRRRFDESGVLEKLFDDTIRQAQEAGLISAHVSADGTLVRANASYKSFVPIEVSVDAETYKKQIRSENGEHTGDHEPKDHDKSNPSVDFRGEKRSNKTHRSKSDPDCRMVSKGSSGTGAYPGYTVNAVMENRNRFILGINVETFQGSTGEEQGCLSLLRRARRKYRYHPKSVGADKGYYHQDFLESLFDLQIEPHVAATKRGKSKAHQRVRMRQRGQPYKASQRCRKKIEELFGEAKDLHGLRRFRRRLKPKIQEELWLIGTILNLKRLATCIS